MTSNDLAYLARLDATAQADMCRRGEISAAEAFDACLARLDALNPLLRAAVTIAGDRPPPPKAGPFTGVPFLVKDAMPWPGLRWSMGSRLFANNASPLLMPYAKRLIEAGLVCAGKSAMSELGLLASSETLLEGATHNPWNLAFSTGGSSGGSAAAVAAGLVPIAHASDGGGSIRIPASACGVFGFKPSRNRTVAASFGSSDFAAMTSDHCISRSVRDSARFLAITEDETRGHSAVFVANPIARALRIGAWTKTITGADPEPEVRRAHDDVIALLTSLGHAVESIEAPTYEGEALSEAFYVVAGAAIADIVDSIDRRRGEPVQERELEPFTWALIAMFSARGSNALAQSRACFAKAVSTYRDATRGYDVVVTPTMATKPWLLGHFSPLLSREELMARTARAVGYTPIHNIAGCPAMSVPLSFPKGSLPIGAHFAAAEGEDALLLGLAYQLEEARPWKDAWPPFSIPRSSSE